MFAGSYDNAEIERYYLVPLLIVVTWLAVLVGAACEGLERRFAPARLDRHGARAGIPVVGFALAVLLVFPTVGALPERWRTVDQSRLTDAQDWLDVVLDERLTGPETGHPLVVELLDPAMVRTADRGSPPGHPDRGRPDPP